jgi:hypothetical protein
MSFFLLFSLVVGDCLLHCCGGLFGHFFMVVLHSLVSLIDTMATKSDIVHLAPLVTGPMTFDKVFLIGKGLHNQSTLDKPKDTSSLAMGNMKTIKLSLLR